VFMCITSPTPTSGLVS